MKKSLPGMLYLLFAGIISVLGPTTAFATNWMNMEGYGPIATGMGGASMAYDNGTAAMMNNPATLGLMQQGDLLDLTFGYMMPNIKASSPSSGLVDAKSSANAFYLSSLGWASKTGALSYGAGIFSQGGMGAAYAADSFLADGSEQKVRSELDVARVIIPVAYNVTDFLTVGGSLDYVWANMDLKMALTGAQFKDMVASLGGTQSNGIAGGPLADTIAGALQGGQFTDINWARFDFSDTREYSGKARATGYAAKIGFVYKVSDVLTFGASYHSRTALGDMQANGATVSMNVNGLGTDGGPATVPVSGKIRVVNFQWPQMVGLGTAYQASDRLMLVVDYRWINWKNAMKDFKMTFAADAVQSDPTANALGLGGQTMSTVLYQNWHNQNVFMLGAGYLVSPRWTVRAGLNIANNPVPNQFLNPLFPAVEKNHIMLGASYDISRASSVDGSVTYAPSLKNTTQVQTSNGPAPVTITQSQTDIQLTYSYHF
jgi:long-chain fatty acid transport protein